jgi:hypothetical protein
VQPSVRMAAGQPIEVRHKADTPETPTGRHLPVARTGRARSERSTRRAGDRRSGPRFPVTLCPRRLSARLWPSREDCDPARRDDQRNRLPTLLHLPRSWCGGGTMCLRPVLVRPLRGPCLTGSDRSVQHRNLFRHRSCPGSGWCGCGHPRGRHVWSLFRQGASDRCLPPLQRHPDAAADRGDEDCGCAKAGDLRFLLYRACPSGQRSSRKGAGGVRVRRASAKGLPAAWAQTALHLPATVPDGRNTARSWPITTASTFLAGARPTGPDPTPCGRAVRLTWQRQDRPPTRVRVGVRAAATGPNGSSFSSATCRPGQPFVTRGTTSRQRRQSFRSGSFRTTWSGMTSATRRFSPAFRSQAASAAWQRTSPSRVTLPSACSRSQVLAQACGTARPWANRFPAP